MNSKSEGNVSLRMQLAPVALMHGSLEKNLAIDSIHIRITADDIEPVDLKFSGDSLSFDLDGLPSGSNRLVQVELFHGNKIIYLGKQSITLKKEGHNDLVLRCDPQFSRIISKFHLPLIPSLPISSGLLSVNGINTELKSFLHKKGEFGSFLIDEIPGDAHYSISLSLSDSTGKIRYESKRDNVLLPLGVESNLDLALLPTEVEASVALTFSDPNPAHFNPIFPSRTRNPTRFSDIVFSEFYAAPTIADSGSAGEWIEVFNRTADTLNLRGCRISKDRSGGITRSYAFDSLQKIYPGQALVMGRSAANADIHYSDYSLVNTSATLFLLCSDDALVVDSLHYSFTGGDTVSIPKTIFAKEGFVSSINADSLGNRFSNSSWCLTKTNLNGSGSPSVLNGTGYASPRTLESCLE